MCGFVGLFDIRRKSDALRGQVLKMSKQIRHRGPDWSGVYCGERAILSHERLSIVDPQSGGQPLFSCDGKQVLAVNGEIYNHQEIRAELAGEYDFQTGSDCEVILPLYRKLGVGLLEKISGIFAFALYDIEKDEYLIARDPVGVIPLYIGWDSDEQFYVASEQKALEGICSTIRPFLPGHYWSSREGKMVRWYKRDWFEYDAVKDNGADIQALREALESAVKRQLMSDVPYGVLLSGGLDSSILSAVAARAYAARNETLHTWSVDYRENQRYFVKNSFQPTDDRDFAALMTDFLGTHHHRVVLDPEAVCAALRPAAEARGLPGMADVDSSLLLFCAAVKQGGTTVCLSGECADELFGGYPWYHREEILFEDTFPWSRSVSLRLGLLRGGVVKNGAEFIREHYLSTCCRAPRLPSDSPKDARMREMFVLNLDWFMATLLDRKDRMSMYSGLEVRVPFCDHRIVEYAYNMPWAFKALDGREKGIVRRAFADELPEAIVSRRKSPYPKTFHPIYARLCAEGARRILADRNSFAAALFDREAVERLILDPDSLPEPWFGQLMRVPQICAYIIQLEHWAQRFRVRLA